MLAINEKQASSLQLGQNVAILEEPQIYLSSRWSFRSRTGTRYGTTMSLFRHSSRFHWSTSFDLLTRVSSFLSFQDRSIKDVRPTKLLLPLLQPLLLHLRTRMTFESRKLKFKGL